MGILAQVFFDYSGDVTQRWFARFPYTRTVGIAAGLVRHWRRADRRCWRPLRAPRLPGRPTLAVNHLGVTGLLLMIAGFMTFTFTLLLHSTAVAVRRR